MDYVVFVYGDCKPRASDEACGPPIEVFSDPPCGPKLYEGAKEGTRYVRSVPAIVKFDGSVRVETPGYGITIYASPASGAPDRTSQSNTALRAFESLRGANGLATGMSTVAALDGSGVAPGSYCQ